MKETAGTRTDERRWKMTDAGQKGFSLMELLIAVIATLVVMGAVMGLFWDGQNTFTREPEVTERQQNIRISMELIQRDILNAGGAMGPFTQVFTDGMNSYDFADAFPSVVVNGENADVLEMLVSIGDCPDVYLDANNPVNGSNLNTAFPIPDCYSDPAMVMLFYAPSGAYWAWGHNIHSVGPGMLNFPPGQQPPNSHFGPPSSSAPFNSLFGGLSPPPGTPVRFGGLQLVRYQIAPDPLDRNIPCLWKSITGGLDPNVGTNPPFAEPPNGPGWELVARGIEDMQVQYLTNGAWATLAGSDDVPNDPGSMAGPWTDTPGQICGGSMTLCDTNILAHWDSLIRQVRVTLWSRAASANLGIQGARATQTGVGEVNLRDRLVSATTPKEILVGLSTARPAGVDEPLWR